MLHNLALVPANIWFESVQKTKFYIAYLFKVNMLLNLAPVQVNMPITMKMMRASFSWWIVHVFRNLFMPEAVICATREVL